MSIKKAIEKIAMTAVVIGAGAITPVPSGALDAQAQLVNAKHSNAGSQQQAPQDKTDDSAKPIKPEQAPKRRTASSEAARRGTRPSKAGNQRQYRLRCRRNPHLRRSKKHRSKN